MATREERIAEAEAAENAAIKAKAEQFSRWKAEFEHTHGRNPQQALIDDAVQAALKVARAEWERERYTAPAPKVKTT